MYNMTFKKSWYIEGYTNVGATYCRDCVADTLEDESFRNPYCVVEDINFTPIFTDYYDADEIAEMYCEYCFEPLG
jgi:hypothetical protein